MDDLWPLPSKRVEKCFIARSKSRDIFTRVYIDIYIYISRDIECIFNFYIIAKLSARFLTSNTFLIQFRHGSFTDIRKDGKFFRWNVD